MITREEAIRLSKVKWQYIVDNDGAMRGISLIHPDIAGLKNFCGLCERYANDKERTCIQDNELCPLAALGGRCFKNGSVYADWLQNQTKENAQKVLDLINQIKNE